MVWTAYPGCFCELYSIAHHEAIGLVDGIQTAKAITQAVLISQVGGSDAEWPWLMAAALISTGPVLLLFMFCQRFFIAGLTGGVLKG